jgi:hypothetical protein
MIKWVCALGVPPPSVCRYLCHANLDRLAPEAGSLSREDFNAITQDIWIDGVWRYSRRGRLPQTERRLADRLFERPRGSYAVLDLGASDGTTTLDLLDALRAVIKAPVTVRVTDRFFSLERFRRGPLVEYRTTQGLPVMVRWGKLAMRLPRSEHRWDVLGHLLARLWLANTAWRRGMKPAGTLSLVHPDVLAEPDLVPQVLDCLLRDESLVGTFDALRAANILNTGYFNREELRAAIACCHAYLHEGGVFVVVRCEGRRSEELECGTIWRKTPEGFERVEDYGRGSEIAAVVDDFHAPDLSRKA